MSYRPKHLPSADKENLVYPVKSSLLPRAPRPSPVCFLSAFELQFALEPVLPVHGLTAQLRARVVDWMIEVLFHYNANSRTVYLAVRLLDICLARAQRTHGLQVLCMTCIYLASKYEDLKPMSLDTIWTVLGHGQIAKEQILATERDVLALVDYCLYFPTIYDWLEVMLEGEDKQMQWLAWLLADIAMLSTTLAGAPTKDVAEVVVFHAKRKLGQQLSSPREALSEVYTAFLQQYEAYKTEKTYLPAICTKYHIA